MENYINHKDVLVHKRKQRLHFAIFVVPIFLVLLAELLILSNNRKFIPSVAKNPYSSNTQPYLSPLASPESGRLQIGVGGGPAPHPDTPSPVLQTY